jgi:2',3'-cyclic-nucleotide 2'-phosphodiesterase/3'-nucleotidase
MVASTIKDLRYFLMKWIEKEGTVEPSSLGNWQVDPDDWWQRAKEKDYQLLYGKR